MAPTVALSPLKERPETEVMAWWRGEPVTRAAFCRHVARVAHHLPERPFAINLCEDRYAFAVAFAAAVSRGQTNLLPQSRLPGVVAAVGSAYPHHYPLEDATVQRALAGGSERPLGGVAADHPAAVAFTSGSTGSPTAHVKTWGSLVGGAQQARARFDFDPHRAMTIVATVPPQHMYGLETSVLVPLVTGVAFHGGRPFYPADIHRALVEVPPPRVLVTTPLSLAVCVEAELAWPAVAMIISATAPLSPAAAAAAEAKFGAPVFEIYGFTEAGSVASRRTVAGDGWQLYDGFCLRETAAGFAVAGGPLPEPVAFNDLIEPRGGRDFRLLGRAADLVNIAGRRASLADLNGRLRAIPGVEDGAFVVPDAPATPGQTRRTVRLAALVVAPHLDQGQLMAALAREIDAAFLPRPLVKVAALPRNATGKLPRDALLALLAGGSRG